MSQRTERDALDLARRSAHRAVERLVELVEEADGRIASRAAEVLLLRALGKPGQELPQGDDAFAEYTPQQRIAALEETLRREREALAEQERQSEQDADDLLAKVDTAPRRRKR